VLELGGVSGPGECGLQAMSKIVAFAGAIVVAAGSAFVLIGPERLWSAIGPADLGPVDFETLERRESPNDALVCPPRLCKARSDLEAPAFAVDAKGLRAAMAKVIASEPRITAVDTAADGLTDRYVQRSALLGFPDTIVVRYLDLPGGTSTVAIYSRSQLGYGDRGVNKARIERWLGKLRTIVPAVSVQGHAATVAGVDGGRGSADRPT
jgi:uncharacterized protein (DUF1499 family)